MPDKGLTHLLHRTIAARLPVAVSGAGVTIRDSEGRDYIDASGGAAVSCLGHGHPDVLDAMRRQMDTLEYAHTAFFTTAIAEELADDLVGHAPPGIDKVYLVSGGSEAMETALKLARQYFVEKGEPQRQRFIARRQSYHGNTLGALGISGNPARRRPFEPLLTQTAHIAPCNAYRERRPDESEQAYGRRAAAELEAVLKELGPESVIGFVAEPVVGATLGAAPPAEGYFAEIRRICDAYGILLILDEVMCGMGRTGTLHACEQEVRPDIMTAAKGLGGGYQAIGAVLISREIVAAFEGGSDFQHGHTYLSHPIACAAALAVQRVIRRDALLDNVSRQGARLRGGLKAALGDHPHVGDVRGRGLFCGIELVADRSTKQPVRREARFARRVHDRAMARGLCVYPGQGTADGTDGDHILIAPPFIVDDLTIDRIVESLGAAIDDARRDISAP